MNEIDPATVTPAWLRRARKAAGYTNARSLLAAVKASEGSAPSYSSYAQWESGEVEWREESLKPVLAFHAKRKTPVSPAQAPDLATVLEMFATELRALREERQTLTTRVDELEAQVSELVAAAPSAAGTASPAAHGAQAS